MTEAAAQEMPARPPWRAAADLVPAGAQLPGWPTERRATALARLDELGLPDSGDEEWRYTSLTAWEQRWTAYLAAAGQPDGPPGPADGACQPGAAADPAAVRVQVIDGVLRQPPGATPPGLFIGSLRQLTPELQARAGALLGKSDGLPPDSLVDLNSALVTDVILVATDAGCSLDATPVHIQLQGNGSPSFSQPRLLVDVGRNSRLTLILEYSGADGTLANSVVQAWVGHGGHLELVRVQDLPDDGMLTDTSRLELAEAASAKITSVDLGSLLSRQSMTVLLAGTGASAIVDGLFLANGRRHIDNRTRLEHQAPATTSRESFRGLADDHGRGVFNGKIIVLPGAAGSNAALSNRNLLLAATAEIDTKPELEIHVDDVRCSHGATTGQLDANALFYLRSRGLDPATARQVLIASFLRESLGRILLPALRQRLESRLRDRLGDSISLATPGAGP